MNKIYFVDTENVGSTWKDLLPVKRENDKILLFFTENSPYISYTDLQMILQYPDQFELIRCNPGKNGLDFQLVSYLGYLMCGAPNSEYIIISNDNGFDAVVKFWQERNAVVLRGNVQCILYPDAPIVQETESRSRYGRYGRYGRHRRSVAASGYQYTAIEPAVEPVTEASADPDTVLSGTAASDVTAPNPDAAALDIMIPDTLTAEIADTTEDIAASAEDTPPTDESAETADTETADTETANTETANTETADTETADTVTADAEPVLSAAEIASRATAAMESSFSVVVKGSAPMTWNPELVYVPEPNEAAAPETADDRKEAADEASSKKSGKRTRSTRASRTGKAVKTVKAEETVNAAETVRDEPDAENAKSDQTAENDISRSAVKSAAKKTGTRRAKKNTAKNVSAAQPDETELLPEPEKEKTPAKERTRRTRKTVKTEDAAEVSADSSVENSSDISAENTAEPEPKKTPAKRSKKDSKTDLIRKYLPEVFENDQNSLNIITDIIFGNDTNQHHELHLAFVKNFGDEQGTVLYKAYRPHLSEYRKLRDKTK